MKYVARNGIDNQLTIQDALVLTSKSKSAADEVVDTDDPIIAKNIKYILRKVMKEDSGTWKAMYCLKDLKRINPDLDFKVEYDSDRRTGGQPKISP